MNIFVLHAHPDTGSFTDGLADAYVKGAGGHQVERTNIRDLQFDLALRGGYTGKQPLEPDLVRQQERIQWCQHLVIVTPGGGACLLCSKATSAASFLPGFAMRYHEKFPYVEPLLRGRTARVIYTQNALQLLAWLARDDLFWQVMRQAVLTHCGFAPVKRTVFGPVVTSSQAERDRWLREVLALGKSGKRS